ncbi:MAG TPA: oligosaccharide flippase family protein [Vicinamibacteria bacterium]|nr:oligosaccharide flippase family protein [Vicinamibacteria bacterium]
MHAQGERGDGRTARNVLWVLLATTVGRLLSLAALAALARLLAPADFGLLAFALVYITYAETVGDLGAGMALIYWPGRRDDAAQVAFALNVGMGLGWFALTLAVAPAVAGFFGNPAGADVLRALAWSFPLKALGNTHDALCQKELRFKARALPELGLATAKGLVAVALAAAGFGVWSLVWGQLAGTALWTALLWRVVPWRPGWRWPSDLLGPMLSYGRGMVGVNVLAAVVHHADLVVVGRMLGATTLGLYHVAYKVPEMTITVVMWAVSRVLFPAMSRARAEGRSAVDTYLAALKYSSLLTVPAAVALALLAEPLVDVLFGPRWTGAAPILSALAVYAGLRSLGTQAGDVLKATGRPGVLAGLGLARALVLVPALVLASRSGAVAVALVMAGVAGLAAVANVGVAARIAQVPLRGVVSALHGGLVAGTAVGALLWGWMAIVGPPGHPMALALAMTLGAMAFVLTLPLTCPELVRRIGRGSAGYGVAGRFLVPLEGAPLRYFHRVLFVPYRARDRLARGLPAALGARLVLEKRAAPSEGDPLSAALGAPAGELLRDTPLEGRTGLRAVVLRDPASADRAQVVAFVFADGDERPAAVLKRRPIGKDGPALRQEWDALCRAAALPPNLRASVPRTLAFRTYGATELLLLSCVPGRSAYAQMRSAVRPQSHLRDHFEQAASWLARFQTATRRVGAPAATPGGALAASAAHGDFWARNVLFEGGRLTGVVDWEHAREEAPPYGDLFHFPLTYGLCYPWAGHRPVRPAQAFRLTFLTDNAVSRAVTLYFRRYCVDTGLSPAALPALFETYLATCWSHRAEEEGALSPRFQALLAEGEPIVFSRVAGDQRPGLQPLRAGA